MSGVVGGVSGRQLDAGQAPVQYPDQISAHTAVLQTGGGAYTRISNALQSLDQSFNVATLAAAIGTNGGDITTLQSQVATLQAQVQVLQQFMASFNYVQAEVSTGTYYLNSALIYRRSFVMPSTMLNTALTVASFAHNIANIGYIVAVQAVASLYQGQTLPMTFVNMATAPSINIGLSVWADQANIYIAVGTQTFPTYLPIATMWYTATDR